MPKEKKELQSNSDSKKETFEGIIANPETQEEKKANMEKAAVLEKEKKETLEEVKKEKEALQVRLDGLFDRTSDYACLYKMQFRKVDYLKTLNFPQCEIRMESRILKEYLSKWRDMEKELSETEQKLASAEERTPLLEDEIRRLHDITVFGYELKMPF